MTVTANPFRGLLPYTSADEDRLFGRERDLLLTKDRVFSARTTLLFAGSGVGKTSFLQAKLLPAIPEPFVPVMWRDWAVHAPLAAIKRHLAGELAAAVDDEAVAALARDTSWQLVAPWRDITALADLPVLLVLDQFEELFLQHAHTRELEDLVSELSELISDRDCGARVLFSMREEFLGELSVFDNRIPDPFRNYYRLRYPDRLEAEEIIESTARLERPGDDAVHDPGLRCLVNDLCLVDRELPALTGEVVQTMAPADTKVDRGYAITPYLQVVCSELWQRQYLGEGAPGGAFLADYEKDQAPALLRSFCDRACGALSGRQRKLVSDSFDYLIGRSGTKRAYDLETLASLMSVEEDELETAFQEIGVGEKRLFRVYDDAGGRTWTVLHHDMFSLPLLEWRDKVRREAAVATKQPWVKTIASTVAVLAVVAVMAWEWLFGTPNRLIREIDAAQTFTEAKARAEELRQHPFRGATAREHLARFWDRRGTHFEAQEDLDRALLSRMRALTTRESKRRGRLFAALTDPSLDDLVTTIRVAHGSVTSCAFDRTARRMAVLTGAGRCDVWEVATGRHLFVAFDPGRAKGASRPALNRVAAFLDDGRLVTIAEIESRQAERNQNAPVRRSIAEVTTWKDGRREESRVFADVTPARLFVTPAGLVVHGLRSVELWSWDLRAKEPVREYVEDEFIERVAVSDNGERLAAVGRTNVRIWDLGSTTPVGSTELQGRQRVRELDLSSDGRACIYRGLSWSRLWFRGPQGWQTAPIEGRVSDVSFDTTGERVAFVADGQVHYWDFRTSASGRRLGVSASSVRLVESDTIVAFDDDSARLIRANGDAIASFHGNATVTNKRLCVAGWGEPTRVVDPRSGRVLQSLPALTAPAVASGGNVLVTWDEERRDAATPVRVWLLKQPATRQTAAPRYSVLARAQDGTVLVRRQSDAALEIHPRQGPPVAVSGDAAVFSASFSPDSSSLLLQGRLTWRLLDATRGTERMSGRTPSPQVFARFSRAGTFLMLARRELLLCNAAGEPQKNVGSGFAVWSLSHDGALVAAARGKAVQVIDAKTARSSFTFTLDRDVQFVGFDAAGRSVVAASEGEVVVEDTGTKKRLHRVLHEEPLVMSFPHVDPTRAWLAFAPGATFRVRKLGDANGLERVLGPKHGAEQLWGNAGAFIASDRLAAAGVSWVHVYAHDAAATRPLFSRRLPGLTDCLCVVTQSMESGNVVTVLGANGRAMLANENATDVWWESDVSQEDLERKLGLAIDDDGRFVVTEGPAALVAK